MESACLIEAIICLQSQLFKVKEYSAADYLACLCNLAHRDECSFADKSTFLWTVINRVGTDSLWLRGNNDFTLGNSLTLVQITTNAAGVDRTLQKNGTQTHLWTPGAKSKMTGRQSGFWKSQISVVQTSTTRHTCTQIWSIPWDGRSNSWRRVAFHTTFLGCSGCRARQTKNELGESTEKTRSLFSRRFELSLVNPPCPLWIMVASTPTSIPARPMPRRLSLDAT